MLVLPPGTRSEIAMAFAKALLAGRNHADGPSARKISNEAFSGWLKANKLDHIPKNDRACYLNIAEHQELAVPILLKTPSRSPQLIWQEVEKLTQKGREKAAKKAKEEAKALEAAGDTASVTDGDSQQVAGDDDRVRD